MISTKRFQALGSTVEGGLRLEPKAAADLWSDISIAITDFERRFSRFRPDSELTKVNISNGRPVVVSEAMLGLLQAAEDIYTFTEGIVDPTIGQALISAGYDQSFELLTDETMTSPGAFTVVPSSWRYVKIDSTRRTVQLPPRETLDFGGLGKGYLLGQLVPLIESRTTNYWLSFGGDLVVAGTDDDGRPWVTGVQDPRAHERDIAAIMPPPGRWGIATSGVTKRRGVKRGVPWHHIIDPRTARPAVTDVLAATVVAPTPLQADVYAKAIVIRGADDGLRWIREAPAVKALIVTQDGQMRTTAGMSSMLQKK